MNPTILGLYAQGFLIRFLHYQVLVLGSLVQQMQCLAIKTNMHFVVRLLLDHMGVSENRGP